MKNERHPLSPFFFFPLRKWAREVKPFPSPSFPFSSSPPSPVGVRQSKSIGCQKCRPVLLFFFFLSSPSSGDFREKQRDEVSLFFLLFRRIYISPSFSHLLNAVEGDGVGNTVLFSLFSFPLVSSGAKDECGGESFLNFFPFFLLFLPLVCWGKDGVPVPFFFFFFPLSPRVSA